MTHQQPAIRINVTPKGSAIPGVQSLEKSSCNCLPDTGCPCPLCFEAKKNPICEKTCTVKHGGTRVGTTYKALKNMALSVKGKASYYHRNEKRGPKSGEKSACAFVGCEEMVSPKYCRSHHRLVNSRRSMYERGNKKWTPDTWDTTPVGGDPEPKQPQKGICKS